MADEPKKKLIIIKIPNGRIIKIPDKLKYDLDVLINDCVKHYFDIVLVIDSREGSGKSRSARIIGAYISWKFAQLGIDSPFSVKNIHFTIKDYIDSSENGKPYQINIMDESREALNRKRGMSTQNVFFTNWLSENRDKRQVHIILLPAIHDLDSYVSMWRMHLLIHCIKRHIPDPTSDVGCKVVRGEFKVYENTKELQQVINNKQKYGYYAYPKYPKYVRKFKDTEPFTPQEIKEYEEKKAGKRRTKYQDMEKKRKLTRNEQHLYNLIKHLQENNIYSNAKCAAALKLDPSSLCKTLQSIQELMDVKT